MRRRGLAAVLIMVLLVATAVTGSRFWPPRDRVRTVEPAALSVADRAIGRWQLGPLRIELGDSGLTVREQDRVLWQSPTGRSFVTAGRGEVGWHEHRGYFWPRVRYRDRLDRQSVDRVEVQRHAVVITGRLTGGGEDTGYRMGIRVRSGGGAAVDLRADGVSSVALISGRSAGAAVHGFGEQFTDFDLSGRLLPIVVREQGVGRGTQPLSLLADVARHGAGGTAEMSYAAMPTFVTEDLRGMRLAPDEDSSSAFAAADLRDESTVSVELWSARMRAELTAADDPAELITAQQSGETHAALPAWASEGAVVGLQGGTTAVRRKLAVLQRADAKISAVWIQDWAGSRRTSFGDRLWWTWQHDRRRYPEWKRLVQDLRRQGIRTTTYVNPMLVDAGPKGDPAIDDLAAEARRRGFLVRAPDGSAYRLDQGGFDAYLVDLTDPRARSWFAQVIADEVLADGVDGFMADFGENLPFDARLDSGSPSTLHNRWPLLWAETVAEGCRRAGKPECLTWFRAAAPGQGAVTPMFWTGDQLVDFGSEDGLASALLGTFSGGVSGMPLSHSDVGGYTAIDTPLRDYHRSAELLRRWAEYQAFGPMVRTHEGNRPLQNAQVYDSAATAADFARMTRLYAALAPYRRTVIEEAVRTGVPAVRHGWLVVPGTAAAEVDTQFFLGDHLLVAPVLRPGADRVEVTLPPGRWVQLGSRRSYPGDRRVTVPAPVGSPAAFVRSDDPWRTRLQAAARTGLAPG